MLISCKLHVITPTTTTVIGSLRAHSLYRPLFLASAAAFFALLAAGLLYQTVDTGRIPDISLNHFANADRALEAGEVEAALAEYRVAARIAPDNEQAWLRLARVEQLKGNHAEAIERLRKVLMIRPRHVGAHYLIGLSYLRTGQVDKAIFHNAAAIRLNPDFAEAHNNLATAMLRQGKREAAIAGYRRALQLKPRLREASDSLAALGVAAGRP